MELTLDQALQKGVEAHKAGKAQEADRYYTAILKANPKHPDANHNMGVLAVGVGKVEEALPFFKKALEVNPSIAQYWQSYIDALIKLDRLTDAKEVFDRARINGAKGDGFDQIELRLNISSVEVKNETAEDIPTQPNILDELKLEKALKLANKKIKDGLSEEAKKIYQDILKIFPKNKKALDGIKTLASKPLANTSDMGEPPSDQLQSLVNFYTKGQYKQALIQAAQLLEQFPKSINLYNIIGVVNKNMGKLAEALEAYSKVISIKPDYVDAYYNMGNTLKEQGKLDEAVDAYNKAISIKPDYVDAYRNIGNTLKEQGKLDEAVDAYNKAISIKPDHAGAHNNIANVLKDQGKLDEAVDAYNKAISIKPDYAWAYNNMGNALQDQGKLDEAIEAYSKALSFKPHFADAYNNLGNTLTEQGKLDEAIEAFGKALSIRTDYAEAYNNMGITLQAQGKLEEAIDAYNKAIMIKLDYVEAHRLLSTTKKYSTNNKHFFHVQELYKAEDLSEYAKCNLSFALSKMHEDIGELDKSFTYLIEGNALRKKLLNYSIGKDEKLFSYLKKTQPKLLKNKFVINEENSKVVPIFILGMPRSGTTLVEQIISSHSEVVGAGELNYVARFGRKLAVDPKYITPTNIFEFRERYLSELSKLSNGKQLVTDKLPHNFRFIPLICAAFPEAKIIHVKRNPAATCWSNYKHYFPSSSLGYCYDLEDVVYYYQLYRDLMKFWQLQYGDRIYHLNYENLTTDQKNQSRKLIKNLGLTWEDACLSPHKNDRSVRTASQQQVRQKVYQGSSEAWRKYEPYLNGAFDSLPS